MNSLYFRDDFKVKGKTLNCDAPRYENILRHDSVCGLGKNKFAMERKVRGTEVMKDFKNHGVCMF